MRYMCVHLGFIGISGNKVYLRFYVYYGYTWVCIGIYWYLWVHIELLFQTTRRRDSNRAKLGPEQGTKQPIPPTFIKN